MKNSNLAIIPFDCYYLKYLFFLLCASSLAHGATFFPVG